MTEWLTADQHYGHESIIDFCERPFRNVDQMDRALIKAHNEVVRPEDEVYFVGDFAWWGPQEADRIGNIIGKLNGNKHLILGNHDRLNPFTYIEYGIISVHTSLVLHDKYVLAHDPSIATVLKPQQTLLCGHVHRLFRKVGNAYNVGVDVHKFRPINLENITAELVKSSIIPISEKINY